VAFNKLGKEIIIVYTILFNPLIFLAIFNKRAILSSFIILIIDYTDASPYSCWNTISNMLVRTIRKSNLKYNKKKVNNLYNRKKFQNSIILTELLK